MASETTMNPEQLAEELRRIAAKIDASRRPSRQRVARAIREIIAKLDPARIDRMMEQGERVDALMEAQEMRETLKAMKSAIAEFEAALEKLESKPAA